LILRGYRYRAECDGTAEGDVAKRHGLLTSVRN